MSDSSTENETSSARSFRKFSLVVGVGIALWSAYATVAWLVSEHPWGAISPAIFGSFIGWTTYGNWKHGAIGRGQWWVFGAFGVVAAAGIAALWIVANTTGEDAYRDQAVGFSFYGGLMVFGGLFMGALWLHPTTRARMQAAARGELEEYLRAHRDDSSR